MAGAVAEGNPRRKVIAALSIGVVTSAIMAWKYEWELPGSLR
jgi:hypothetical protein